MKSYLIAVLAVVLLASARGEHTLERAPGAPGADAQFQGPFGGFPPMMMGFPPMMMPGGGGFGGMDDSADDSADFGEGLPSVKSGDEGGNNKNNNSMMMSSSSFSSSSMMNGGKGQSHGYTSESSYANNNGKESRWAKTLKRDFDQGKGEDDVLENYDGTSKREVKMHRDKPSQGMDPQLMNEQFMNEMRMMPMMPMFPMRGMLPYQGGMNPGMAGMMPGTMPGMMPGQLKAPAPEKGHLVAKSIPGRGASISSSKPASHDVVGLKK